MELITSKVLWVSQVFLTFIPAWFIYSLFRQARQRGYREQSALPFAAALFTWTIAGVINALSAFSGHMPYTKHDSSSFYEALAVVRVLLSTINTLLLTIGATRLDNFPSRFLGFSTRSWSNRWWVAIGLLMLAIEGVAARFGGELLVRKVDAIYGFAAVGPIAIGLIKTFLRYKMGTMLTAAIISALVLLELVLIKIAFFPIGDSPGEALYHTSIFVTSKVAFMIVLVMVAAAWGHYYTSETFEEVKKGGPAQKIQLLFEVIPSWDTEYARRRAYDTILLYWPDSPVLLESIKIEGPSKEAIVVSNNLRMIADLIDAGVLNLSLSPVGNSITTELIRASARVKEHSNGQIRSHA